MVDELMVDGNDDAVVAPWLARFYSLFTFLAPFCGHSFLRAGAEAGAPSSLGGVSAFERGKDFAERAGQIGFGGESHGETSVIISPGKNMRI